MFKGIFGKLLSTEGESRVQAVFHVVQSQLFQALTTLLCAFSVFGWLRSKERKVGGISRVMHGVDF